MIHLSKKTWSLLLASCLTVVVLTLVLLFNESRFDQWFAGESGNNVQQEIQALVALWDSPWMRALALGIGTLISEDAAAVLAGLLVEAGQIPGFPALVGIFLGVWIGDFSLYLAGAVARRVFGMQRFDAKSQRLAQWFDKAGWQAILISRVIPGTRLPMYFAIGALGGSPLKIIVWTAIMVAWWVPLLVLGSASVGEQVFVLLDATGLPRWLSIPFGLVLVLVLLKWFIKAIGLFRRKGRLRLRIALRRLARPEFWPGWMFYLPQIPWIAWLALRHGGLMTFTAANPGIRHSGFVGESKTDIFELLPEDATIPQFSLATRPVADAEAVAQRIAEFHRQLTAKDWSYPLIIKPDAGQRGAGVKKVSDHAEAEAYVRECADALVVQPWHPGPHEAGIYYYRFPHEERGHVLGITHKVFPVIHGDGIHSLRELLWQHPRFSLQIDVFLERHEAQLDRVLADDESFPLASSGNHCQGTMFADGEHLITDALCARVDQLAQSIPGFYVGRFDVRYSDIEAFKRGEDLAIVELNGVTAEPGQVYDPEWPLRRSLAVIRQQWSLCYAIGAANHANGLPVSTFAETLVDMMRYYRSRSVPMLAD